MNYRRFKNKIVLGLDRGEEITEQLKVLAQKEHILLAQVEGLGATDDFTVGLYDVKNQKYLSQHFTGDHEIVSLTGSINTMNGEYYSHMHISCAGKDQVVVGGHLNKAVISGVGEIFVTVIEGKVDRYKDSKTGLNVFDFNEKTEI